LETRRPINDDILVLLQFYDNYLVVTPSSYIVQQKEVENVTRTNYGQSSIVRPQFKASKNYIDARVNALFANDTNIEISLPTREELNDYDMIMGELKIKSSSNYTDMNGIRFNLARQYEQLVGPIQTWNLVQWYKSTSDEYGGFTLNTDSKKPIDVDYYLNKLKLTRRTLNSIPNKYQL
jgi:hypothetical protein